MLPRLPVRGHHSVGTIFTNYTATIISRPRGKLKPTAGPNLPTTNHQHKQLKSPVLVLCSVCNVCPCCVRAGHTTSSGQFHRYSSKLPTAHSAPRLKLHNCGAISLIIAFINKVFVPRKTAISMKKYRI